MNPTLSAILPIEACDTNPPDGSSSDDWRFCLRWHRTQLPFNNLTDAEYLSARFGRCLAHLRGLSRLGLFISPLNVGGSVDQLNPISLGSTRTRLEGEE
jgi:hypothetical protein